MKKFLKVLDGEVSNASGYHYKIGEINISDNWNPSASEAKDMGGFNFSSEDKILRWLLRGNTLYDVDIPIDAEVVEVESETTPHGLFRTNKILLNNPRPITPEMAMDLYLKSDLPDKTYFQCLTFLALDNYYEVCKRIISDRVNDNNVDEAYRVFSTFFDLREEDKTNIYHEVEAMLLEIKNKELINVCITREPLVVKLSDDNIINITGQSGAGKTYYIKEHYDSSKFVIIDTDEVLSEKRFENATGINREIGEMLRQKYEVLPDLGENFDLIYNDIMEYCSVIDKPLIIDCAQFHCVKDISVLRGKVIVLRTDINTCYERCKQRFLDNNSDCSEEEYNDYKERKKKIYRWYKETNKFIEKLIK